MKQLVLLTLFVFMIGLASGQSTSNLFNQNSLNDKAVEVSLYPNPATDLLNIKITDPDSHELSLNVYSIIGTKIETKFQKLDNDTYQLDIKDFTPGYYLFTLRSKDGKVNKTYKFLKR
ncbi:MAG: T9SS type A sorting domain-containing protein [Cyclobacteriaceae bacterium]|nr:T9SS type A sorting domain-containing protein [Cyclobacteriaceae bacterium]